MSTASWEVEDLARDLLTGDENGDTIFPEGVAVDEIAEALAPLLTAGEWHRPGADCEDYVKNDGWHLVYADDHETYQQTAVRFTAAIETFHQRCHDSGPAKVCQQDPCVELVRSGDL